MDNGGGLLIDKMDRGVSRLAASWAPQKLIGRFSDGARLARKRRAASRVGIIETSPAFSLSLQGHTSVFRSFSTQGLCTMILGQISYIDCAVFLIFLAPQLILQVGFVETFVCAFKALPFLRIIKSALDRVLSLTSK